MKGEGGMQFIFCLTYTVLYFHTFLDVLNAVRYQEKNKYSNIVLRTFEFKRSYPYPHVHMDLN
jgi:hypothetical protein